MAERAPPVLVVVGASAGGVAPLQALVAGLTDDLPAALGIVLHVSPHRPSRLPEILGRAGPLPALHARDGEPIEAGRIYVAPPDHHLLVDDDHWRVVRGPRENQSRPAIDPLFRSAAVAYGARTIAVVLSGTRDDGVAGSAAVSDRGGKVIVQTPQDADFGDMPAHTIARDHPDHVVPLALLAETVTSAVGAVMAAAADASATGSSGEIAAEARYAALDRETIEATEPPGNPSAFACPACGGVLWEIDEPGEPLRYRCRVGHAFTPETALDEQSEEIDRALFIAYRALQERAELSRRVAERLGPEHGARFVRAAAEAGDQAELIRSVLLERSTV